MFPVDASPVPLSRSFFERPPATVARELLGKWLVRQWQGEWLVGRLVEVEAYLGEGDRAAHAFRGRTPRNAVLFGPPGHAYVYRIYGLHWCLNVSTEPAGRAGCVLLRALEPLTGQHRMLQLAPLAGKRPHPAGLLRGPGRLTRALAITQDCNGVDLTRPGALFLAEAEPDRREVITTSRIGITQAAELPLRFYLHPSSAVSFPRYPDARAARPPARSPHLRE